MVVFFKFYFELLVVNINVWHLSALPWQARRERQILLKFISGGRESLDLVLGAKFLEEQEVFLRAELCLRTTLPPPPPRLCVCVAPTSFVTKE